MSSEMDSLAEKIQIAMENLIIHAAFFRAQWLDMLLTPRAMENEWKETIWKKVFEIDSRYLKGAYNRLASRSEPQLRECKDLLGEWPFSITRGPQPCWDPPCFDTKAWRCIFSIVQDLGRMLEYLGFGPPAGAE